MTVSWLLPTINSIQFLCQLEMPNQQRQQKSVAFDAVSCFRQDKMFVETILGRCIHLNKEEMLRSAMTK